MAYYMSWHSPSSPAFTHVNTYSTPVFTPVDTYSAHANLPLHVIRALVQLREGYLLSAGKEIKVRFKDLTWILRTAPV